MYDWLVLFHVLAAFAFVFAHGTSAFVILRLRSERDIGHVRLLLEVSQSAVKVANLAGIVLIVFGIWAGIDGGWWSGGRLWIWTAVVLLVLSIIVMYALVARHTYGWRDAVARQLEPSASELDTLMTTPQPWLGP